ncbi:MAG: glycine cleavage system aminomethyltransferase GcvT, partial [Nitrososphaerales archaeon]
MGKKSHLYSYHKENGKLTEFGGFEMPLWYRSIIEEHNAVRNSAGLFDVSHMGRFVIQGEGATPFLNYVLPSDTARVKPARAFYSAICNEAGGIIDDTVTNKFSGTDYTMVVNASNRDKDISWLRNHSNSFSVEIKDDSDNSALLAFQGPLSLQLMQKIADIDLNSIRRFATASCNISGVKCIVSRTGYTGEDGFEITVLDTPLDEPKKAEIVWNKLLELGKDRGIFPCGLGARDSLRLEAGMCLYGNDIDDTTTPVEASLDGIVGIDKQADYVGKSQIVTQLKSGTLRKRVAFSMLTGGIPRHGHEMKLAGSKVGTVTSG